MIPDQTNLPVQPKRLTITTPRFEIIERRALVVIPQTLIAIEPQFVLIALLLRIRSPPGPVKQELGIAPDAGEDMGNRRRDHPYPRYEKSRCTRELAGRICVP